MQPRRDGDCGLLDSDDPRESESYKTVVQSLLEMDLEYVLAGDERAVLAYVVAWRAARSRLLEYVVDECPDLKLPPLTVEALDWEAVQAPFSDWMRRANEPDGLALDLIARLRNMLVHSAMPLLPTQLPPTQLPERAEDTVVVGAASSRRFYRQIVAVLEGRGSLAAQITESFGLSKAELGRVFGVSRQAATDWLASDVPHDRRAKASVVISISDLLAHRLKPGRLPGVARRSAAAYGGLSMLDMIAADRHEELLDSIRASFNFAQTA